MWSVYYRGHFLGTVEAFNADDAKRKAASDFDIDDEMAIRVELLGSEAA